MITRNEITNATQTSSPSRKVVSLTLMDNDPALPVEHAVVATFKNIVTESNDNTTIMQVIADNDFKSIIEKHNKVRQDIINEDILTRTGQEVKLRSIKLKDLNWTVAVG